MQIRSPEILIKTQEKTDQGFSEKRAARIIEGVKQDNSQVKKTRVPVRQAKVSLVRGLKKIKIPVFRKRDILKKLISRRGKI